jgi:L-fuculose-phosphate aldolase
VDETGLRRALIDVARRLARRGLITAAEGNLSVRLGGRSSFLATPAGAVKDLLGPGDLVVVDADGRSGGTPTSEWPMHAAIYRARPDVAAVCHAHAPWSTACAVAGRELDGGLLTETTGVLPTVPVAPRARPGSEDLAAGVAALVRRTDAVLLANHGVVAVGPDLETACRTLETVERLAQVTVLAELLGGGQPPR